jgi:hypothetical protein
LPEDSLNEPLPLRQRVGMIWRMDENTNAVMKRRGPDRKTWYVVAHAVDMTTAEIPAGLLRSAGIPVYLFREAAGSSAIPVSVGLLGGVDVAVPEAYFAEAMALLDEGSDDFLDELPPGEEDPNEDR